MRLSRPAHKVLPVLEGNLFTASGEPGWSCKFYNHGANKELGEEVAQVTLEGTDPVFVDSLPPGLESVWSARLEGFLKLDRTASFELGLTVNGQAELWVNDELLVSAATKLSANEVSFL